MLKKFPNCFLDARNIATLREHSASIPGILHADWDELDTGSPDLNADFDLKYCLFGSVKLARNANADKYS